jgi:hypothetical protein
MMFSCDDMDELAPAYTPAALNVRVSHYTMGQLGCVAFWLEPVSVFGSL